MWSKNVRDACPSHNFVLQPHVSQLLEKVRIRVEEEDWKSPDYKRLREFEAKINQDEKVDEKI